MSNVKPETIATFIETRREERKLKQQIEDWFAAKARDGILTAAYQAPMWSDYEAAADRYSSAFAKLDEEIEALP